MAGGIAPGPEAAVSSGATAAAACWRDALRVFRASPAGLVAALVACKPLKVRREHRLLLVEPWYDAGKLASGEKNPEAK